VDAETNTVTVGPREALLRQTLVARGANYVAVPALGDDRAVHAQIRAHDAGAPVLAWDDGEGAFRVAFAEPRAMLTPGQAVVLYEGDDVLAGGWIDRVDP
jgi:tRNA-uridine 2-sulfurtransferase